ncbi:hypothetical protein B9T62_34480 [Paenibacillus donghaensis]|uniref:Uncharacterized protein n=1 Tax=Paenibacillus donghaensis TaxID=414771 RepID=A0A2Z2KF16_9BACL|nr:hypothetical protein B9T62_34480 [Paenibacillus donghaensis]
MPYNFTPDESVSVQIALIYSLEHLEERLKSFEDRGMPSNHTQTMIDSTRSALDKIRNTL